MDDSTMNNLIQASVMEGNRIKTLNTRIKTACIITLIIYAFVCILFELNMEFVANIIANVLVICIAVVFVRLFLSKQFKATSFADNLQYYQEETKKYFFVWIFITKKGYIKAMLALSLSLIAIYFIVKVIF